LVVPSIDEFSDSTADKACAAVLNAQSAVEVAQPSSVEEDEDEDSEYEYESEDDQSPEASGPKTVSWHRG
jgi:hypothetical protein